MSNQSDESSLKELCETLCFDYVAEKQSRARVVCAILGEKLHEDLAFDASYKLLNFGPKNDWNGHRSAATRAAREWEARILNPALETARKIKARRAAQQSGGLVG